MKYTLILTSQDREYFLSRFFGSAAQNSKTFAGEIEIIFINQGAKSYRHFWENIKNISVKELFTGRKSLSEARNIGLEHAAGEIIAFPDDDCWYPPKLLSNISNYFEANPAITALCVNVFDPYVAKSYGSRPLNLIKKITPSNLFTLPISVGLFVRSAKIKETGLKFDETLGAGTKYGSGEETEFINRLMVSGASIQYNGTFSVYHELPNETALTPEKAYRYGIGFGHLSKRLIFQGHLVIFLYFLSIICRSLAGALLFWRNQRQSQAYLARFRGAITGFLSIQN